MMERSQSLFTAILEDDRAKVKALLNAIPRPGTQCGAKIARLESRIAHWIYAGDTALHVAAAGYRVEIAKMLLAAGAEVGAAKNHRRSQPLHYTADGYLENPAWNAGQQVAMIRLLLAAGADIHAQDKNGATPLHRAVRTRCAGAVKCLLDAGSDPAMKNKPGSTSFHLAVQNTGRGGSGAEPARAAQREIIRTFLQRGVSPALKDGKGSSVLQWAEKRLDSSNFPFGGCMTPTVDNTTKPPNQNRRRIYEQSQSPGWHQEGRVRRLTADGKRKNWEVNGPHFAGWEMYHLKGSPVDPNRIYASQTSGWFGQIIQRSRMTAAKPGIRPAAARKN